MRMVLSPDITLEVQILPEGLRIHSLRTEVLVIRDPQLILETLGRHYPVSSGESAPPPPVLDQTPS